VALEQCICPLLTVLCSSEKWIRKWLSRRRCTSKSKGVTFLSAPENHLFSETALQDTPRPSVSMTQNSLCLGASTTSIGRPNYSRSVSAPAIPTFTSEGFDPWYHCPRSALDMRLTTAPPHLTIPRISSLVPGPASLSGSPAASVSFEFKHSGVSSLVNQASGTWELAHPMPANSGHDESLDISSLTNLIRILEQTPCPPAPPMDLTARYQDAYTLTPMQAEMLTALGLQLASPALLDNHASFGYRSPAFVASSTSSSEPVPVSFQVRLADLVETPTTSKKKHKDIITYRQSIDGDGITSTKGTLLLLMSAIEVQLNFVLALVAGSFSQMSSSFGCSTPVSQDEDEKKEDEDEDDVDEAVTPGENSLPMILGILSPSCKTATFECAITEGPVV
jgi:hypothetical protein